MVATYPTLLAAGSTSEGSFLPFELYAGEADIVTTQFVSSEDIDQFEILVQATDGTVGVWNGTDYPGGAEATMVPIPIGIAAQAFLSGATGPVFVAGVFNVDALNWPSGVSTLANRRRAFVGTGITVQKLLGGLSGPMTLP